MRKCMRPQDEDSNRADGRKQNPTVQNGAGKDRVTDQDKAVLDLKARQRKIKTYTKQLELREKETTEKVKDLLKKGERQRAMIYLKQVKFHKKEIEKAQGAQMMLQDTLNSVTSAMKDKEVFEALKHGDALIKELHE